MKVWVARNGGGGNNVRVYFSKPNMVRPVKGKPWFMVGTNKFHDPVKFSMSAGQLRKLGVDLAPGTCREVEFNIVDHGIADTRELKFDEHGLVK